VKLAQLLRAQRPRGNKHALCEMAYEYQSKERRLEARRRSASRRAECDLPGARNQAADQRRDPSGGWRNACRQSRLSRQKNREAPLRVSFSGPARAWLLHPAGHARACLECGRCGSGSAFQQQSGAKLPACRTLSPSLAAALPRHRWLRDDLRFRPPSSARCSPGAPHD